MDTKFTKGPWKVCRHLQSIEKDAECPCGYNGGVWGNDGETLICEMGNCRKHEGSEMIPIADRPTQLADAALISAAPDLFEALRIIMEDNVDYMTRNNLGDPENQHTIKVARAAISKALGQDKE